MDEETCEDLNMSTYLGVVIALQVSVVMTLLLYRIVAIQRKRENFSRRAFLDNFILSSTKDSDFNSKVDKSVRTLLVSSFLETGYGRWFKSTSLRSGKWDPREVSKFVGRKFEIAIAGLILAFLLEELFSLSPIFIPIFMLIGFVLPDLLIRSAGERRAAEIARALPETIDLLNMTVGAGLGFQAGLDRIARTEGNPLSDEFRRVLAEIRLGDNRTRAFTAMAERINRSEIWNFTNAIAQVEKLGIPITKVLQDQAKTMRAERREKAREQAQKLPVKILAPIMIFLLPAVMVIVLAPAVFTMFKAF